MSSVPESVLFALNHECIYCTDISLLYDLIDRLHEGGRSAFI